jgi:hypothetical protein
MSIMFFEKTSKEVTLIKVCMFELSILLNGTVDSDVLKVLLIFGVLIGEFVHCLEVCPESLHS